MRDSFDPDDEDRYLLARWEAGPGSFDGPSLEVMAACHHAKLMGHDLTVEQRRERTRRLRGRQ